MPIKESRNLRNIYEMYDKYNLNKEEIIEKTKYILSIYRQSVWSIISQSDEIRERGCDLYGSNIDAALMYLSQFAPNDKREIFEDKINKIFNAKWMIEIIDTAMEAILNYPKDGNTYFQILSKTYLTKPTYKETEIVEMLNIDRSTLYRKRKEAVALLGAQLWGYAIPHLLSDNSYENMIIEIPYVGVAQTI